MKKETTMRSSLVRLGLAIGLTSLLGVGATPALAAPPPEVPTLDVGNPNPGDMLIPGVLMMHGIAFDDNAEEGLGVDRVSVFLGDRELGGRHLGDAILGGRNVVTSDPQFAGGGWRLKTPVFKGSGKEVDLFVYARSTVNGQEAVVVIPIKIGDHHDTGGGRGEEGGPEE